MTAEQVGPVQRRRRYPTEANMVITSDVRLIPVGDGTAILMSGMEVAMGLTPADVLARESVETNATK